MNKTKAAFIYGFAIFAGFFGAGNLILPPYLGFQSGGDWWQSALGFVLSGTVIPFLALFGHSRLRGTMLDFGNKLSKRFSLVLCILIYFIAILLPCPRTAAVAHEMAIAPYFELSSFTSSLIYFILVLFFALNRGKAVDILGKYLTPSIGLILLAIIGLSLYPAANELGSGTFESPLISGFLEGYQTYDAIAGLLMGGILVISIQKGQKNLSPQEQKIMIARSGFIAMTALFIIYIGLIYVGSQMENQVPSDINRTGLLSAIATSSLGQIGSSFLSVLVSLACFTTAVGIIVGTADFFSGLFNESKKVYRLTIVICCLLGVLVGQLNVEDIIKVALPVLMFIYPIAIVLIILNLFPERYGSVVVFRSVVSIAFIFSIPDFLQFLLPENTLNSIQGAIPFSKAGLGWVIPSILTFILVNSIQSIKRKKETMHVD